MGQAEWDLALREIQKIWSDEATVWLCLDRARAEAAAGRMDEYQGTCTHIMDRFGDTDDPNTGRQIVQTVSLAPNGPDTVRPAVELARRIVAKEPDGLVCRLALGCILYRAGDLDEAQEHLRAVDPGLGAPPDVPPGRHGLAAWTWLCQAMVSHDQNQSEQAQRYLDHADAMLGELPDDLSNIPVRILRVQAERHILGDASK